MAESSWTLTDFADDSYLGELEVTPASVGGTAKGYRIHKQRLRGGVRDAVDVIRVDNGRLRFDVLPTRGMGLWKAWLDDQLIGWNSPVKGPVHPAFVPLNDPSGLGWLEGFDELLVRCGLESNGAPDFDQQGRLVYGLHGRIANKPAHYVQLHVDGDTGEITLRGVVDEVRFHFFKLRLTTTIKTKVDEARIEIHDKVENLSASPAEAQLLYHINLGPPLLAPGSTVVAPVKALVPRDAGAAGDVQQWSQYAAPQPGVPEQVYFLQLYGDDQQQSVVLLKSPQSDRGVSVAFDVRQLPCFTLWKNQIAEADGYVTGLEPATNYPNPRSFEQAQQRVVSLAPGASTSFDLCLQGHSSAEEVEAMQQRIEALGRGGPTIHNQPQPSWCAGG